MSCDVIADEFNIYTQEAGPGMLTVNIDGPSKAKIDVVDRRTGFVTCSYMVDKEGRWCKASAFFPRWDYYQRLGGYAFALFNLLARLRRPVFLLNSVERWHMGHGRTR